MKFISWNVNGLKACIDKGFKEFFYETDADFFCIQETKISDRNFKIELKNYDQYWAYCERKGYSGTAVFTKHKPLNVSYGMKQIGEDSTNCVNLGLQNPEFVGANYESRFSTSEYDTEGRLITLEYDRFFLINVYTPNSKHCNKRLDFRMDWDDAFKTYAKNLNNRKPLIICGDINVAHLDIDIAPTQKQTKSLGFTDEEREKFSELLESVGLNDTFRYLHPTQKDAYTWWSYRHQKRDENSGLRLDYFLLSDYLIPNLKDSYMCSDVIGSDHCPIALELEV